MIHYRDAWGLWWPDSDRWPERTYAYVEKHLGDMGMTLAACPRKSLVVQAGGHVGIWPRVLASHFHHVVTYEPDPAMFLCLERNALDRKPAPPGKVYGFNFALGDRHGPAHLTQPEKAGSNTISSHGEGVPVSMLRLDDHLPDLHLGRVDALILDIEGCEIGALRGARETIERDRPAIHVEQLKPYKTASHDYLRSIGYDLAARAGHDALYLPDEDHRP